MLKQDKAAWLSSHAVSADKAGQSHDLKTMHCILRQLAGKYKSNPSAVQDAEGQLAVTPRHVADTWLGHFATAMRATECGLEDLGTQ
eukprot:6429518-Alexandrium_andersonii.AAC.1